MVINPISLRAEYEELQTKVEHTIPEICISSQALVITPYQVLLNQIRELSRGDNRFGSCGRGVGETIKDAKRFPKQIIRMEDLSDLPLLKHKLRFWRVMKTDEAEQLTAEAFSNQDLPLRLALNLEKMHSDDYFQDLLAWYADFSQWPVFKIVDDKTSVAYGIKSDSDIIFEGAQGALLHRDYGFYPHITQSDTSFQNAEKLIKEQGLAGEVIKLGIMRAYMTRHGAGPFVTYDLELTDMIPEANNVSNDWQGDFQCGWLDLVATRYALKILGEVNGLVVTNLDRLASLEQIKTCASYEYSGSYPRKIIEQFFETAPVSKLQPALQITGIKLLSKEQASDYEARQIITNIMRDCRPVYQIHKVDKANFIQDYVQYLETVLQIKVLLTSAGPRASEKTLLTPLSK